MRSDLFLTCYISQMWIFSFQGFSSLKDLAPFSPTLSFPFHFQCICIQLAFPQELLCVQTDVKGCCCALNKLKQTRHVSITCFKMNPLVYHSIGQYTGRHRLEPTFGTVPLPPCRVPLSHNRCLIREDQGGAHTSWGLSNEKPPTSEQRCRALLWFLW